MELASPDHFIPVPSDWRTHSPFIARHGDVDFHHFDFRAQALGKLARGHDRDVADVRAMEVQGLISRDSLREAFEEVKPRLVRYPGLDPEALLDGGSMTTSASKAADLDGLPGGALVEQGLRDLAAGEHTAEALLLCVAASRLRSLGLEVPLSCPRAPELALYRALADAGCDDPYYRYNALLRELDSFLEAATSRQRRRATG